MIEVKLRPDSSFRGSAASVLRREEPGREATTRAGKKESWPSFTIMTSGGVEVGSFILSIPIRVTGNWVLDFPVGRVCAATEEQELGDVYHDQGNVVLLSH